MSVAEAERILSEIHVPDVRDFQLEGVEFLPAPQLEAVAERLVHKHVRFSHLLQMRVIYLWKMKGGETHGANTLGKCQSPSGLLAHFSNAEFVIWLAADHCRDLSNEQIEAVVFHEMCHTASKDGEAAMQGHDVEMFADEVRVYGAWKVDLLEAQRVFGQLPLDLSK